MGTSRNLCVLMWLKFTTEGTKKTQRAQKNIQFATVCGMVTKVNKVLVSKVTCFEKGISLRAKAKVRLSSILLGTLSALPSLSLPTLPSLRRYLLRSSRHRYPLCNKPFLKFPFVPHDIRKLFGWNHSCARIHVRLSDGCGE